MMTGLPLRSAVFILLVFFAASANASDSIRLEVDASDIAVKTLHARMQIPAPAGTLKLFFPKWIPGEHGPTGPLVGMAGLRISAGDRELPWRRDPLEMYEVITDVPAASRSVEVEFDFLPPVGSGQFTAGASVTPNLTVVSWNTVLLYPAAADSDQLRYQASLKLPHGWQYATALPTTGRTGDRIDFAPVSLTTLIDSPVLIGQHMKKVSIATGGVPHSIDIASDSDEALETPADFAEKYRNLVDQAGMLFGARHYQHYDWLLTLSDHVEHFGLEHHQSSDDRMAENTLGKEATRQALVQLLAHEYVHSWNGKYRRPAGLAVSNYDRPMQSDLLWVYEGLTQYLGKLLAARSGSWTPEFYRESLALTASNLTGQVGRTWRPLADTAVEAQILYGSPDAWSSYRRSTDFYEEGVLVWLDADITIRKLTGGAKSLNDFTRNFYGGASGDPEVMKPYTFEDIVKAMTDVVPFDWRKFFNDRLTALTSAPPMGGIETGGWRLVYNDQPNEALKAAEESRERTNVSTSLGMWIAKDGSIGDTQPGSPAAKAGIAPSMKLVAVNGRRYTPEVLRDAIKAAESSREPIELLVQDTDFFSTHAVEYHGGFRYPHLERTAGKADLLETLLQPMK